MIAERRGHVKALAHLRAADCVSLLVRPEGIEPPTLRFEVGGMA
jgi:hypothetical protein